MSEQRATSGYLVWRHYVPGHVYASVQSETGIELDEIQAVRRGRRLEPPPEKITIVSLTGGEVPDVMSSGWGGRYVSLGAKRILEKHGREGELQFIPAEFSPHLGQRGRACWLLNVTASGAFFDRERSDFDSSPRNPNVLRTIRRMELLPIPEDSPAVLHMEELVSVLLIRRDVAEEMEASLATPGEFVEPRDYTRESGV